MNIFLKEDDIWALSITITGKCNCDCSYCHFYAIRNRKQYNINMPEDLFCNYVKLIKEIKEHYHQNLQVRFSGGEPLVIGDKLFEYSNLLYNETGCTSYVLTNGRLLTEEIIEKSKQSHITAYLVSIENPFDQSEGAPKTDDVLEKIKTLNCEEVNVLPAVMVVKNDSFNRLLDICDYVYNRIGILPAFSELTYHAYEIPTPQQYSDLHDNIKKIAQKYYGKAAIRFFPYVSPELFANGYNNYLTELDLENSIQINSTNINESAKKIYEKLHNSYVKNPCTKSDCDWYEDCRIIKWLWLHTYDNPAITRDEKLNSFCNFKKALNSGLLEGILLSEEYKNEKTASIE